MGPIEGTKAELQRVTDRMLVLLDRTPDDRLFWKPSPTARSIAEVVAHASHAIGNIEQQLRGIPFAIPSTTEANAFFAMHDAQFTTRAAVRDYLSDNTARYVQYLDSLTPEDLERSCILPFGIGEAPVGYFMTMVGWHTMAHNAQIEYIQTMYGDSDWHLGF
ncbi:MAG: DinB family protein [Fimbriimonadaceae bacterium]|nr:DinB family protein [Fimbriimonadaceae bacterium]